jgi:signal transduction histidine kinase
MSNRLLKIVIPLLAVFGHIGAFLQFRLQMENSLTPSQWILQFYFLLSLSMVCSLLLLVWRKTSLIWTILILQGCILLLVSLPIRDYFGVAVTLLTILLIETLIFTKLREGLIFSAISILVVIISQQRISAWNIILPAITPHALVSIIVYAIIIITLTVLLRFQNNVSFRELNRRLNEATANLAEINLQLQEYAAMAEHQAITNERKRFGREIHDTLAYMLTNLIMMLEAAIAITPVKTNELRGHLGRTRDQAKEGLAEVRRALHKLRPIQIQASGLSAINNLVKAFTKATHVEVELNLGDVPLNFGEEIDLTIYRLVQEGITNALRHGKASRIALSFNCKENGVNIWIKDNGVGSSEIEEGFGLLGMRERIERLGGNLQVSSKLGEGFLLVVWLPIEQGGGDHGEN